MFKVKELVWVMGCVSIMGGCAAYQSRDKQAVSIKPLMDVKHAGGSEAMYWLGRYHQGKTHYTKAIEAYEKALTENPGHAETHNGLGVCYSVEGRHERALQHLRKAIELAPTGSHLYHNLGYAHLLRGQDQEAAAAFEQALRLDPENWQARRNLATVYEQMGLLDKAAILSMMGPSVSASPVAKDAMPAPLSASLPVAALRQAQGEWGQGSPSATIPVNLITPTADEQTLQEHRFLLVQITPDVFEFSMNEGDLTMTSRTGKTANGDGAQYRSASPGAQESLIEVSNGNGVTGMARTVSEFLQHKGLAKARLTDQRPFQQIQTEIQYRPGSYSLADQVSHMMPNQPQIVESHTLRRDIRVRVMLGKDMTRQIAYFAQRSKIQIAQGVGKAADTAQPGE
jgi:Tfp pilus assembly protein PilF